MNLKEQELSALQKAMPAEVLPPDASASTQAELANIDAKIKALRAEQFEVEAEIAALEEADRAMAIRISNAELVRGAVQNILKQFGSILNGITDPLNALSLDAKDVVQLHTDTNVLEKIRDEATEDRARIRNQLDQPESGARVRRARTAELLAKAQGELTGPSKTYQEYLSRKSEWDKQRKLIVGAPDVLGSLEYYKAELDKLGSVPQLLSHARQVRRSITISIFAELEKLAVSYRELYRPVQQFASKHEVIKDKFPLNFEVKMKTKTLVDRFLSMINRGVSGTFNGMLEGEAKLKDLIAACDLEDAESVADFADGLEDRLKKDYREAAPKPCNIEAQIRKSSSVHEVYDYIYGLEWLVPQYALRMGDKELTALSPGERGTLLLVFYLLIDSSEHPLVIDQPEENLDNQTVYKLIGTCLKEAKKRRQVVIVTHNPNLAVACDAEQVVHAKKTTDPVVKISYTCGAIENPIVNQAIVDILEGTRPAFENRDAKYFAVG